MVIQRFRTFKFYDMKKANKFHWLLSLVLFALGSTSVYAQFDDLYFDESEFQTSARQTEDLAYQDFDDATIDEAYAYDEDEYDEYLQYRESDYDIDAYRYTCLLYTSDAADE